MKLREQAEKYLTDIAGDVRHNTLATYRSIFKSAILPVLGEEDLASIDSATAKLLKDHLIEGGLSPATVNLAVGLLKKTVGSATDARGNRLYAPKWNNDFIRLPRVNPKTQKAPIAPREALSGAITATKGEIKVLIALLGGSGLRIGEALALRVGDDGIGNLWDPEAGTVLVRAQRLQNGEIQAAPKTEAGNRVVDLHPVLNSLLKTEFGTDPGPLFRSSRQTLYRRLERLNIPGFHSLRRRRITNLKMNSVPDMVIKFWSGHAAGDITERYAKVGSEITARRDWSEKAELGF